MTNKMLAKTKCCLCLEDENSCLPKKLTSTNGILRNYNNYTIKCMLISSIKHAFLYCILVLVFFVSHILPIQTNCENTIVNFMLLKLHVIKVTPTASLMTQIRRRAITHLGS